MPRCAIDEHELSARLAQQFPGPAISLERLSIDCTWPVYRMCREGLDAAFVKVMAADNATRMLEFLRTRSRCGFFPKPMVLRPLDFGSWSVVCLSWLDSQRVNAEDMTDRQLANFCSGCRDLSEILNRGEPIAMHLLPIASDSPDEQYGVVAEYAARHSLAGRLLRPLLSIPISERSFDHRPLVVIHGDFQPANYGFNGERFAAVYDFDSLRHGLACEDAAYAFTERARRRALSADARRRLERHFLWMVRNMPWPRKDWLLAVNHARLRIASRRLLSHPNSPLSAVDVLCRDAPLKRLYELLEK